MATTIRYNGINPFEGIAPTPYVGRDEQIIRYGEQWGVKDVFTLVGQITGECNSNFADLVNKTTILSNNFSKDFQNFQIYDDGNIVIDKPYCRVTSISIPSSRFINLVPFTVTLEAYRENTFSGTFGIINPENRIDYNENPDGTVTITHTVSAEGFNTSNGFSNALENAKNYVLDKSDFILPNIVTPIFVQYDNLSPCLNRIEETVDRFNAKYILVKTYNLNQKGIGYPQLSLNFDITYQQEEGIYNVSVQGSMIGCMGMELPALRSVFKQLDFYSLATTALNRTTNDLNIKLNPNIITENIEENETNGTISFNLSYNSDVLAGNAYFEYTVNISYDELTEAYTVALRGEVKGLRGQKSRWENVLAVYNSINPFAECNFALYNEYGPGIPLNPYPKSHSVNFDERACVITIDINFVNLKYPYINDFKDFNYTINISPVINLEIPVQTLNNGTKIFNINTKMRGRISVDGSAISTNGIDKSDLLKNIAKSIVSSYFPNFFLEENQVSRSLDTKGDQYSFNCSASFSYEDYPTNLFTLP